MKNKDIVIKHETGFTLSLDLTGAYDFPDMEMVWKFYKVYEPWYIERGRFEQLQRGGWCFTESA